MADQQGFRTGATGPDHSKNGGHLAAPEVIKKDIRLIVISTVLWLAALALSGWDFYLREYAFNLVMTIPGVVLVVLGFSISREAKRQLGRFVGPGLMVQPGHKLVKTGLYRSIRHPSTTSDLLFDVGIPLVLSSYYGLILMLFVIIPTLIRIKLEEEMMLEHFGEEYRDYMRHTKKLIPGIY